MDEREGQVMSRTGSGMHKHGTEWTSGINEWITPNERFLHPFSLFLPSLSSSSMEKKRVRSDEMVRW